MQQLSDLDLARELKNLPGWEHEGTSICRWFDRSTFKGAIAFVNTVAEIAERAQHHPDIDLRYSKVRLSLTTHDAGGLTDLDVRVARQITAAAE